MSTRRGWTRDTKRAAVVRVSETREAGLPGRTEEVEREAEKARARRWEGKGDRVKVKVRR
jgi:hypothetical protein